MMGHLANKKNSLYVATVQVYRSCAKVCSQNMVCDIEPEQRYDITGKQWQQRREKDLGAYQKRQRYRSLLLGAKREDKIGLPHSPRYTPYMY